MQQSQETDIRIQVAKLEFCCDDSCQVSELTHLNVDVHYVELLKSKAIAISYTWGEFDRRDVVIGHDAQGKVIHMNLGMEWDIQELIARLALICINNGEEHGEDHAACWIDQLCVVQAKDDEIRKTLASIPSIYRMLNVVALMPGALCGCLRQEADNLHAEMKGLACRKNFNVRWSEVISCVNSAGLCSYFSRVWTRQELLYGDCIQVMRTSDDEIPCVKAVTDLCYATPFVDRLYTQLLLDGNSKEEAFRKIQLHNGTLTATSYLAISEWRQRRSLEDLDSSSLQTRLQQVEFLLGHKIERQRHGREQEDYKAKVHQFLLHLGRLGLSPRAATQARDYVTSIWVDCPKYVLPKDFKSMGLPSLLQDAIQQLEDNHGVSIQATHCMGLFEENSIGSGLWRPLKYMGWKRIINASQVYNVVLQHPPIPIIKGRGVPIYVQGQPCAALSRFAMEYLREFRDKNTNSVYQALKPIFNNWPRSVLGGMFNTWNQHFTTTRNPFPDKLRDEMGFGLSLIINACMFQGDQLMRSQFPPEKFATWERGEIDHYQAVYRLVTAVLNLDFGQCQRSGLDLVVSLGHHPCIGLMNKIPGDRNTSTGFGIRAQQNSDDIITIWTNKPYSTSSTTDDGDVLLEAYKIESSPVPKYHVAGIWVPHGYNSSFNAGSYIQGEGFNAFIV